MLPSPGESFGGGRLSATINPENRKECAAQARFNLIQETLEFSFVGLSHGPLPTVTNESGTFTTRI